MPLRAQFQLLLLELRRQEGWTVLHCDTHDLDIGATQPAIRFSCLNRRLLLQWVGQTHALSPSRLSELYGPNMVPYRQSSRAQRASLHD